MCKLLAICFSSASVYAIIVRVDGFEEVEHTADCALRIWGRDLEQLLVNAALGLAALLTPERGRLADQVERTFELKAYDAEMLLVEWLSELLYWAEVDLLIFQEFLQVEANSTHLRALARGGHVSALRRHIKAVTYHDLNITRVDDRLQATVVFDV